MYEIFKTVLILSVFDSVIIVMLLCLKPITVKRFPARWQYYVWIAVLLSMVIPAYKLIPKSEAQKLSLIPQNQFDVPQAPAVNGDTANDILIDENPIEHRNFNITHKLQIKLTDLIAYIWFSGMCIFLIIVISNYALYRIRKHKNSVAENDNRVFYEVKQEYKIKRNIKVRRSMDFESPMLVGVLFPIVYIPLREIPNENMRMIFLHELTHYKRKDLFFKWLSLFVNAVHWFNPLVYLVCANVSEACEVSCDMAVTKNMSDTEQKVYMKTILDLVE